MKLPLSLLKSEPLKQVLGPQKSGPVGPVPVLNLESRRTEGTAQACADALNHTRNRMIATPTEKLLIQLVSYNCRTKHNLFL